MNRENKMSKWSFWTSTVNPLNLGWRGRATSNRFRWPQLVSAAIKRVWQFATSSHTWLTSEKKFRLARIEYCDHVTGARRNIYCVYRGYSPPLKIRTVKIVRIAVPAQLHGRNANVLPFSSLLLLFSSTTFVSTFGAFAGLATPPKGYTSRKL